MKAILEFQLPEDRENFEIAQDGWRWRRIVEELWEWARRKQKYEDQTTIEVEILIEKIAELKSIEGVRE